MEITKSRTSDLPKILEIIKHTRAYLKDKGIDQWQSGYPNLEDLKEDIRLGWGYVVREGEKILAYFAWFVGDEPDYHVIHGDWKTNGEYSVIHRLAVKDKAKGTGSFIFKSIIEWTKALGVPAVRVDTHEVNLAMQGLVKKHGFEACGKVYVNEGERIGFEKVL